MRAIAWLALVGAAACVRPGRLTSPSRDRGPEVRFLAADPPGEDGRVLVEAVPGATWDAQLARAVDQLLMAANTRTPRLSAEATSTAAAVAGYPGQARFARVLNGGAFPHDLVHRVALAAQQEPVDVALARRTWGDGTTLWILGWAPRRADLDPLPRDLPLDGTLAVRADLPDGTEDARLFVATPSGPVEELALTDETPRWVDRFHEPGAYRIEVVARRGGQSEVALLWTAYVDTAPPPVRLDSDTDLPPPDPHAAERELLVALNQLRAQHGLAAVRPFPLFDRLAREHSALMAVSGVVAHSVPGQTPGVPVRARDYAHPRARHHENVAAADTAAEALALVTDSPGHLRNLLCEPCTHVSLGVALEPVLDRRPRLFVTWELLEFPHGPPQRIDRLNR